MTIDELEQLKIKSFDEELYKHILDNWDHIAKPLNGLGDFEKITARIGAIGHDESIDINKRALVMMCADNGIIEEGVSQSGSDVTTAVATLMGEGISSVCKMALEASVDTFPIDIGIKDTDNIAGVYDAKIRRGTRNFAHERAMTSEETLQAIETGINIAGELKTKGYKMIATGEMGIGNTTTSATLIAAMLKLDGKQVAGRGAGLSDEGLNKKIAVIDNAICKYDLYNVSPFEALMSVGGLDIAGLCGIFIGGALHGIPIVIDGIISATAALAAEKIVPGCREFFVASHSGAEKGLMIILNELGLEPVINGKLALGEGTGAVMIFPLLDMTLAIYKGCKKFSDTEIEQYERFT